MQCTSVVFIYLSIVNAQYRLLSELFATVPHFFQTCSLLDILIALKIIYTFHMIT